MKSINFYPYKVQLIQELKPQEFQPRLPYGVRLRELAENDLNFFDKRIMSGKTHFHLNGLSINKTVAFGQKKIQELCIRENFTL